MSRKGAEGTFAPFDHYFHHRLATVSVRSWGTVGQTKGKSFRFPAAAAAVVVGYWLLQLFTGENHYSSLCGSYVVCTSLLRRLVWASWYECMYNGA